MLSIFLRTLHVRTEVFAEFMLSIPFQILKNNENARDRKSHTWEPFKSSTADTLRRDGLLSREMGG
jgi:hypothetical protein